MAPPARDLWAALCSSSLPQPLSTVLLTLWVRFNQRSKGDRMDGGSGWDGMEWDRMAAEIEAFPRIAGL